MAITDLLTPLRSVFAGLSPARRLLFILLVAGTAAAFGYVIFWAGEPDFQPLYSNLQPDDAGLVVERLKAEKIPYRVAGANTILVPRERVFETTMTLASQGLPQGGGVGFEIFDTTKLGMTEFEQNINYQRALQGELARTISRFPEVRSCRVHIVMPSDSLFLENDRPASASVILDLATGQALKKQQVQGIVHLISASVSGLSPDRVTLVDTYGNMLSGPEQVMGMENSVSGQLEFQHRMERLYEHRVKSMLEEVLGSGKSIVRVSCELDFKKQETTEEIFDPNKVVRSERKTRTLSSEAADGPSGVPGVMSNMTPAGRDAGRAAGKSDLTKEEETANYELTKTVRRVVAPVGGIKRVSVAVIVDGAYQPAPAGSPKDKKKKEEPALVYVARTPGEMEDLARIVRRAINFDETRGDAVEVVNLPFHAETAAAGEEDVVDWRSGISAWMPILKYMFAGVVILFLYLLVARPLVKWLTTKPAIDGQMLRQLPMTVGEMEREFGDGGALTASDQLGRAIAGDRDRTAQLIRDLLREK